MGCLFFVLWGEEGRGGGGGTLSLRIKLHMKLNESLMKVKPSRIRMNNSQFKIESKLATADLNSSNDRSVKEESVEQC